MFLLPNGKALTINWLFKRNSVCRSGPGFGFDEFTLLFNGGHDFFETGDAGFEVFDDLTGEIVGVGEIV